MRWADDRRELKLLSQRTKIPLSAGESELTSYGCRALIDEQAIQILQFDCTMMGGFTEGRKLAALCELNHVEVAPHHDCFIHAHIVAASPAGCIVESFTDPERDPLQAELFEDPPKIVNGMLTLKEQPGLGLTLSPSAAEEVRRADTLTRTALGMDKSSAHSEAAYAEFLRANPAYLATQRLDALRETEYSRLDRGGHVYLDYTAGSLYAESQLRAHMDLLARGVFGNPHSTNPTATASTALDESARSHVLDHFNASPDEYVAIFTANASGALKLVGESFPFVPESHFLLTFDNHNSVNGIREFARARGAKVTYIPVTLPEMRVDESSLESHFDMASPGASHLFAYPAQSNFSGVQHPLAWIERAHAKGWIVLLDAAAYAPTNRLDLGRHKPDFVDISFYKMFGYPTGVGCLIARRDALVRLRRPWFAGGTITVASVQGDKHYLADGPAAFEDGTIDYLNLPAVEIGLRHIESTGIETIHERVRCLTGWLLGKLLALRHGNDAPLVRLYGPSETEARGGTITVNFYDRDGQAMDHLGIEQRAGAANISLRTGCFCNPGGGEMALGISGTELSACFHQPGHESRLTLDDFRLCIDGKSSGAVRISLGIASNFADVEHLLQFAAGLLES